MLSPSVCKKLITGVTMLVSFFMGKPASFAGTAIISKEDFGECVVKLIHDKMNPAVVKKRLTTADRIRVDAAKCMVDLQMPNLLFDMPIVNHFVPFSKQDSYEVLAFHSNSLMDFDKYQWGKSLRSKDYLHRLRNLYWEHRDETDIDFTLEKDFLGRLNREKPAYRRMDFMGENPSICDRMLPAADDISDPLVLALLKTKDRHSIGPWELVKKATEIYDGDVLTALGAIGWTFDSERFEVRDHKIRRSKRLYLGSRVKALFSDGNVLGQNYHFWMYLNAGLQGKYYKGKIMSLTYQNLVGDPKEQQADSLGLSIGDYIRSSLQRPNSNFSCPLESDTRTAQRKAAFSYSESWAEMNCAGLNRSQCDERYAEEIRGEPKVPPPFDTRFVPTQLKRDAPK